MKSIYLESGLCYQWALYQQSIDPRRELKVFDLSCTSNLINQSINLINRINQSIDVDVYHICRPNQSIGLTTHVTHLDSSYTKNTFHINRLHINRFGHQPF